MASGQFHTLFADRMLCPPGLTTEDVEESFLMEAAQGDSISGKISREEAASVVNAALQTPASNGERDSQQLVIICILIVPMLDTVSAADMMA